MGDLSSCLVMSMFGKQNDFSCQKLKWLFSNKKCKAVMVLKLWYDEKRKEFYDGWKHLCNRTYYIYV